MLTLVWSHRTDNCLGVLEYIVANLHIAQHLAHTRNHRSDIFEVAEFLHLVNLGEEVVEVELVGHHLLGEFARLLLIELLLRTLNE